MLCTYRANGINELQIVVKFYDGLILRAFLKSPIEIFYVIQVINSINAHFILKTSYIFVMFPIRLNKPIC